MVAAPWNAAELRRIDLQAHQRAVRVAQLGVDDFGVALEPGFVLQVRSGAVGGEAAHANIPRAGAGQFDAVAALVAAGGLAADGVAHRLDIAAAVVLHVDGNLHAGAGKVARVRVLEGELRNAHREAQRINVRVADLAHYRRSGLHLGADSDFALHLGEAGHVRLRLRAVASVDGDAAEVLRAVGIFDRRVVEIDALQAADEAFDLALGNHVEHAGILPAAQRIRAFGRRVAATAATAAFSATTTATSGAANLVQGAHAVTCSE